MASLRSAENEFINCDEVTKQTLIKVAFQGEPGAYSEEAAFRYFGNSIETIPRKTFSDVFRVLEEDEVDYSIVPVENSLEGSVGRTHDLLLRHDSKACGEVLHRIRHCLISLPGTDLESVKSVYSHPQALGQCREFLEGLKCAIIPFYDTAGSIKMIKENDLRGAAGIASERAAGIYEMKVIKEGIETNHQNYTRFLVLSEKDSEPTGTDKTSVIFTTKHVPGALYKALGIFAVSDINLTRIESRPIVGRPWEYSFFLDFEGHRKDRIIREVLEILKYNSLFVKVIGSYAKAAVDFSEIKKR